MKETSGRAKLMARQKMLTAKDRTLYEWQLNVPGFGERGQQALKNASVLISRTGGLGGGVAYQLAAAGIGKLVLAHGGKIKPGDLNRQLLMTHAGIGQSRVESAARRLRELNPQLEIVAVNENVNAQNAKSLVAQADLVVDCAPLFEERFPLNAAAFQQRKPIIECAMYELEGQLTVMQAGRTPCLRCLYPEHPSAWKRRFPVFGAVSGVVGCLGALEAIKVLSGLARPLFGILLTLDLRTLVFRQIKLQRNPACSICGRIGVSQNIPD